LILTDLPYGNMNKDQGWKVKINGWDLAIEPKKVFEIANRVLRKNGKMILFSQEPYTTKLIRKQYQTFHLIIEQLGKKIISRLL
jgi:site-specific DNA-methyltransferase (adenine-specific)